MIIDSISTFSGDFASDLAGNLYVSDNDDLKLYKFTPQQLTTAINGAALQITDGQLVTTLNKNGSLAVDGFGRILSAGYQSDGFDLFDPANGSTTLSCRNLRTRTTWSAPSRSRARATFPM